jgi:hypothetical protein
MNSKTGGILFGLAFRTAAKTISHNNIVRDYLMIAAYGFVILFISDQVTSTDSCYQPFGLATISFMGLSGKLLETLSIAPRPGRHVKVRLVS